MNPLFNDNPARPIAIFYTDAVHLGFRSEQEGRPIYEDREFIKIMIPGDARTEVVRQATDQDKDRFDKEYAIFKRNGSSDDQVIGTPLSQVPWISPSQAKEMSALNIRTVEHLAEMTDTGLQKLGLGARDFKLKAQAYLDAAAGGAEAAKYAVENERLKAEVERLTKQNEELAALADNNQKRKSAA